MELVQSRIVTDNIERLAAFYAQQVGVPMALNEYYVEVHAGPCRSGCPSCDLPNTTAAAPLRQTAEPDN